MAQMPEIKPVVNKEPERDKKKAGLLARLFGGGGSGSTGLGGGLGFAGAGSSGGFGGLVGGGGLLATKAGLLALLLAGTTVAGGIGMIGYRLFGPGADATGAGDNLQLFAPKPKDAQNADGQGAAKDGTSASLQYLNQANSASKDPDAAANGAPKDATAGGATGSDATAGASAAGPLNKLGDAGNGVNKGLLKSAGRFGALTAPGGGGGSGAVANSAVMKPAGDSAASSKGSLAGFKKSNGSTITGGSSRAIASRRFGGAAGQGFGALRDNRGAQSSYAGGRTYDGASAGGSNIQEQGGTPIGTQGVGTGGGAQPRNLAGPATTTNNSTSIPTPPATELAPWQNSIRAAQVLLALGGVILFVMSKLGKTNPMIYTVLNVLVGVIAAGVIALGAQIAGGQYGQKLQGAVLAAAGAGLMVAAAMAMGQGSGGTNCANGQCGTSTCATCTPAAPAAPAAPAGGAGGFLSGINPYVLIGGGAVLIGVAGTMLLPPKKYPSTDFQNGTPPDSHWFGYRQLPSEAAAKKLIT